MNKRGDDRYISFWLFLNMILIVGAIVLSVYIFYSAKIDVRKDEADLIGVKLLDCVIDSGKFNEEFLKEDFNIFEKCQINKDVILNRDYYFNISIYKNKELVKENVTGVRDFELQCQLAKEVEGEFPGCYEDSFIARADSQEYEIRILTASNQEGGSI